MAKVRPLIHHFNGGVVSKKAIARTDLEVLPSCAVDEVNWIPKARGEMQFRPGFERMGAGGAGRLHGVKYDRTFSAVLDFRDEAVRFWDNDGALVTRPAATLSITNGDFAASTGWTLTENGASTLSVASGQLTLVARRYDTPTARQEVTADAGTHYMRITVARGPVRFRAGSAAGLEDYFSTAYLRTGVHDLAITNTAANFWVELASEDANVERIVDGILASDTGALELTAPWDSSDLRELNLTKNIDVHYVCHDSYQQRRVERRGTESWGVAKYESTSGPFVTAGDQQVRMTLTAKYGNTMLTASEAYFTSAMVGSLIELTTEGQSVTTWVSGADQVTEAIEVAGGSLDNRYAGIDIDVDASWSGTIHLQRAFGAEVDFSNWGSGYTADTSTSVDETNDSSIVYVRAKVTTYSSGTARVTLTQAQGETVSYARITALNSSTSVDVEMVTEASSTDETRNWRAAEWSDAYGWPSAASIHDARLFFGYGGNFSGSVTDSLESFNDQTEGDSGPIQRAIGGDSREIAWLLSMQRLLIGTGSEEFSVRASSFDEPLTPSAITVKSASTQGSSFLQALKLGDRAIFLDQDRRTLHQVAFSPEANDYRSSPLDVLIEDLLQDSGETIVEMALQRRPEQRIWCLLSTGRLLVLVFEPGNRVQGYFFVELGYDHTIESVACRAVAGTEDEIWIKTLRDGVRHTERMFPESAARGGTANKMADCAYHYSGAGTSQVTCDWLANRWVVGWADGYAIDTVRADASGVITLRRGGNVISATEATVGLGYGARYKGVKAAYGARGGSSVTARKAIDSIGLAACDICLDGLMVGTETGTFLSDAGAQRLVRPVSTLINGIDYGSDKVFSEVDFGDVKISSADHPDPRLVIEMVAPYPATIIGAVMGVDTHG